LMSRGGEQLVARLSFSLSAFQLRIECAPMAKQGTSRSRRHVRVFRDPLNHRAGLCSGELIVQGLM
jgi:hypothetical protein